MGFCALIGGGLSELTFVDSAFSLTASITIPATAQEGDIAVLMQYGSGSPTPANPPDFTTVATTTDADGAVIRTCYKHLEAGDPGAAVTGMDGPSGDRKIMLVFRPDDEIENIVVGDVDSATGAGDPTPQAVAASGAAAPLIVFGVASGVSPNLSCSPAFDDVVTFLTSYQFGYQIQNGTPSDSTVSLTASSGAARNLQSFYLSVS